MENNLLQKRSKYFDNHSSTLKMSTEVKYTVANNSKHAKEPKNATIGSTGYAHHDRIKNRNSLSLFWESLS